MTGQEENSNTSGDIERFMQDRQSFGILHLLGMKIITAEAGTGRVGITVDERLMHPQQIVHGGVIFTLADTAMSMALLPLLPQGTLLAPSKPRSTSCCPCAWANYWPRAVSFTWAARRQ